MKTDSLIDSGKIRFLAAATTVWMLGACETSAPPAAVKPGPSATATPAARKHPVYEPVAVAFRGAPIPTPPESPFDFQRNSPAEFLEFLAKPPRAHVDADFRSSSFAVTGIHVGWIRSEDLPALHEALDDARPCMSVVGMHSSILPGESTVGREAAFLIDGYYSEVDRTAYGGYPPAIHSGFATPAATLRQKRSSTK